MAKNELMVVSGKRKRSVAKAFIYPGNGKVSVNNIPYQNLFMIHRLLIEEPLMIAKNNLKGFDFDLKVKVIGGGRESQIEAARLAIARAIVKKSKSEALKKAFSKYDKHLLVADVRRKEAYKPGDSKARSKRQKSYR